MAKVLILVLIVAIDLQARADDAKADYDSEEGSDAGGHDGYAAARPRIPHGNSGSGGFESIPDVDRRDLQARADDADADYDSEEGSDAGVHDGYAAARPRIPHGNKGSGGFESIPDVERRDLQARAHDAEADYDSEQGSDAGVHDGYAAARPRIPHGNSGSGGFESIPDVDRRDLQARADDADADYDSEEGSDAGVHDGFAAARPRIPHGNSGSGGFESIPGVDRRDLQARADDPEADYDSEEGSDAGSHDGNAAARPRMPHANSGSGGFESIPDVDRRDLQA